MVARDIMNKIVTAAKKNTIGRDLAIKLLSGMYSGLPVVDDKGKRRNAVYLIYPHRLVPCQTQAPAK